MCDATVSIRYIPDESHSLVGPLLGFRSAYRRPNRADDPLGRAARSGLDAAPLRDRWRLPIRLADAAIPHESTRIPIALMEDGAHGVTGSWRRGA
jgi:hypothetical protein